MNPTSSMTTISLTTLDYSRAISHLLKQPSLTGRVHSIFRRAINIEIGNTILSLLSSELPRMPNGLCLSTQSIKQLLDHIKQGMVVYFCRDAIHRVHPGVLPNNEYPSTQPAFCRDTIHRVHPGVSTNQPGRDESRPYNPSNSFVKIHIALPDTPPWNPHPPIESYSWHPETIIHNAHLRAHFLQTYGKQEGLAPLASLLLDQMPPETPLIRMALPMLRILTEATWQQNIEQLQTATRGLAGLGPGLTPSGDDVLGGFIAALTLLSEHISSDTASRKHLAETIVYMAIGRTTKFSATLLAHAARGEVAEHLGELIIALSSDDNQRLLQAASRLLSFGATSGGDTLLGVLLGIHSLLGKPM